MGTPTPIDHGETGVGESRAASTSVSQQSMPRYKVYKSCTLNPRPVSRTGSGLPRQSCRVCKFLPCHPLLAQIQAD
eukprot:361985-Chlamydomonas_euryale.AAC.5